MLELNDNINIIITKIYFIIKRLTFPHLNLQIIILLINQMIFSPLIGLQEPLALAQLCSANKNYHLLSCH